MGQYPAEKQSEGQFCLRQLGLSAATLVELFEKNEEAFDSEGWFLTDDIGTIDGDGLVELTDRAKGMIKSGGEWISSIALENFAINHPAVAEAAAIGIHHRKWEE